MKEYTHKEIKQKPGGCLPKEMPDGNQAQELMLELLADQYVAQYRLWCYPGKSHQVQNEIQVLYAVKEEDLRLIEEGNTAFIELDVSGDNYPDSIPCQFSTDFWSPGTFPEQSGMMGLLIDTTHPALKKYPTRFHSDWQWWAQSHGRALVLPREIKPIVRALDHVSRLRNLGLLVEVRLGNGRVLLSGMGLHQNLNRPECRFLLECLLEYLQTPPSAALQMVTKETLYRLIHISSTNNL